MKRRLHRVVPVVLQLNVGAREGQRRQLANRIAHRFELLPHCAVADHVDSIARARRRGGRRTVRQPRRESIYLPTDEVFSPTRATADRRTSPCGEATSVSMPSPRRCRRPSALLPWLQRQLLVLRLG